jgi:hypothetical protein
MKRIRLATLLSILGVVLTAASVVASIAQYRAADLQAQATMLALMPQIEVRSLLERRDSEFYTDRRLVISSDGGPIYDYSTDRETWFDIRRGGKSIFEQPLNGYFHSSFPTSRIKGEVETIIGYKNNEKFISFDKQARKLLPEGCELANPKSLLAVSYRDAFRKATTEYFFIDGGAVVRLEPSDGEARWKQAKEIQATHQAIDLDSLSAESAVADWARFISPKLSAAK